MCDLRVRCELYLLDVIHIFDDAAQFIDAIIERVFLVRFNVELNGGFACQATTITDAALIDGTTQATPSSSVQCLRIIVDGFRAMDRSKGDRRTGQSLPETSTKFGLSVQDPAALSFFPTQHLPWASISTSSLDPSQQLPSKSNTPDLQHFPSLSNREGKGHSG